MNAPETRFAVLIFTDIVGSTDLKTLHGVPAYRAALGVHNRHFEGLAAASPGFRILQNMGDGYFAEASGVAEAVRFALLFQQAMREGPWGEVALTTRVGIHAGEVTVLDSEGGSGIVAPAADMAARVMSLAVGGQILLTRLPFDEARHFIREHPAVAGQELPPLQWLAHGPYRVKGRDEPLEIFEVGADGLAPLAPPPDGEKAKRVIRPGEEETLGWRPAAGLEIPGRPGWHLIERLGEGGFGEVWSGEHAKLHQRRAFKFCFDDERLRSLKREVTLVRLLRSALGDRDDIVRIHEIKLDEPPFYLESDLAPHGNLLQWAAKQGGLENVPLNTRIGLVAHTATALASAHSLGVLHKDIKPTNILIFDGPNDEPRPRLVDFGIGMLAEPAVLARFGVTGAGFTRPTIDHSTGTPTYSPPELLAGRPYTIQGDIYGLGVLLYQLVTAKPLEPLAPGWERDVTDPLLREDIAACVDGDPARRLASAAELAERLETLEQRRAEIAEKKRLAADAEARVEAEAAASLAKDRAARLRRLTLAFALLSLLAMAGGILAWSYQRRAARDQGRAEEARSRAEGAEAQAVAQRDRANELLEFQAYSHALERGDLAAAFTHLSHAERRQTRWEYGLGFGRIGAAARASFVPVQRIPCPSTPLQAVFCCNGNPAVPAGAKPGDQGRFLLVVAFHDSIQAIDLGTGLRVASHALESGQQVLSLHEIRTLGQNLSSGVAISFLRRSPQVLSLPDLRPVCEGPADLTGAEVASCRSAPVLAAFRDRTLAVFEPNTGRELARKTFAASAVDRIAKVSFPHGGQTVALTSFRLAPLRLWNWTQDVVESGERMQSFDFPSDDSHIGLWSWQFGGDFAQILVRDRQASGMCKLWFPRVPRGTWSARRIYQGESVSDDFLLATHDESAAEFFHLTGANHGAAWKGAVVERSAAIASALSPHIPPQKSVRLLTVDAETQQLAVGCGETVAICAPRGPLFGEKGVGVAGKSTLPSGVSQGRFSLALPCNFWAACSDGGGFWSVTSSDHTTGAAVSKFTFAQDGWRVSREDYFLEVPEDLTVDKPDSFVIAAITKDPTRRSLFVLWDRVTHTLHSADSTSLDLEVARYDLPTEDQPETAITRLSPALRLRLSEHPRDGLRAVRGFLLDESGEVLLYATEKVSAGYSVRDGKLLFRLPAANRFAFSGNGKYLAMGNWRENRKVEVRECRSGNKVMETETSQPLQAAAFSPDGTRLAVGWKQGKMEVFEVSKGTRVRELTTDLAPVLLLPEGDRFVGIRVTDADAVGDAFLADANDANPIHLLASAHALNRWYVNPSGNLIAQVSKYEVPLFRRSTPDQLGSWLDALWPGGVVMRDSVLAGPGGEGVSRTTLVDDKVGTYRSPPPAPHR